MVNDIIFEDSTYPVFTSFREVDSDKKKDIGKDFCIDAIEIVIVNNGSLRIVTEDETVIVNAGQGIIINKNVTNSKYIYTSTKCGFYVLIFRDSFVSTEKRIRERYIEPLLENRNLSLFLLSGENIRDDVLLDGFNRIITANMIKKDGYELYTKALLCYLWKVIVEYGVEKLQNGKEGVQVSVEEKRVDLIIRYMEEHFGEAVSLEDLANNVHLSNSECCRCFKRVTGMTPMEFLLKYRIFQAVRILSKDPGRIDSISELSFITGFNNASYFTRIFRRIIGCTPMEYKGLLENDPGAAERIYSDIQEEITVN